LELIYYVICAIVFAILFAIYNYRKVIKFDQGSKEIQKLSEIIHKGAMSFIHEEYKIAFIFVAIIATILFLFFSKEITVAFLLGAIFSALCGYIGMNIATKSNGRTAWAVKKQEKYGLYVAFSSGLVTGMCVVGLGLFGIVLLYKIYNDVSILFGFGFGASSIALFARVGGGIYTKAADVGADLVGKVEAGIPEDDPRNPAVIADNIGDNVGDVAGMGADLFESYVDSIIAAMVLGVIVFGEKGLLLPLIISSVGIVSSIIGSFFVRVHKKNIYGAIDKGIIVSAVIMVIGSFFVIKNMFDSIDIFYCILFGLISGVLIGIFTEYVTSPKFKPTRSIAEAAQTGAATNIIKGLSVGMLSTAFPIIVICIVMFASHSLASYFGVAMAAVGMLSILGITLATDAYGPVVDNAEGIAQMAHQDKKVRRRTEKLDEVGNSTAAMGKGFAIGSAALTSLALFVSYINLTKIDSIDLTQTKVMIGLFIGTMMPFIFSSFTMDAVGKAAEKIVQEVRIQFHTIKGLLKGKAQPDYDKCIQISVKAAMKGMIIPGVLSITVPLLVGKLLGAEALGGLLAGVISCGFVVAIFMANSGGAWDNAKKYIEEGHLGGKRSLTHKAAVVGDTVGDPFKDTCGPSLNILIKLMTIVSLVFAPLFL
jgi:K(+)-stimulated pyrophosphate-energized sodium pump